jgi:hypothetical protein
MELCGQILPTRCSYTPRRLCLGCASRFRGLYAGHHDMERIRSSKTGAYASCSLSAQGWNCIHACESFITETPLIITLRAHVIQVIVILRTVQVSLAATQKESLYLIGTM